MDNPEDNPKLDPLRIHRKNTDKRRPFKSAISSFTICVLLSLFTPAAAKGCLNIWMDGKETAKCDGQGLISVPSGLSSSIHVIRLENNNFQILPSKVFQERGLINLQKIFLSNCSLGMIAQDAFHQLNHLVELDLGQNLLTTVPSESFRNLLNVRRLLLRQNPIKILRESNFISLNKLEHLDLSYCQINQIEPGSFKGIPHLKSLKLNNNQLTMLTPNVFVDIPPLYTIALEHNPWNCDCELRPLHQWISVNNMLLEPPQCKTPAKYENKDWSRMLIDELACTPTILPSETDNSGPIGGNATFRCRIRSSPRPEIDWRVEEPTNLVLPSNTQSSSSANSNGQLTPQPSPPYTLNTLSTSPYLNNPANSAEERFIISEPMLEVDDVVISTFTLINLQPDDAQRKFVCNAKNKAGLGQETFTINVYSASTGVLKGGSISGTLLIILLIVIFLLSIGLFVFTRHRKRNKPNSHSANNGVSENKLDVLKNVKNSLVGNHHIKKSATVTAGADHNNKLHVKNDQDLPNSQKLKITENTNGGLYVNGYTGSKPTLLNGGPDLMNSNVAKFSTNLQYNPAALSPYAGNLNSSGLTLLNNEMPMSGDMINGSSAMLNYSDPRMINVGPNDFAQNNANLASSQYGTASFVQSPVNHLMPYQATASGYLDTNPAGYLGSNDQLLNGFNNYENMYSPFNQQYVIQQQQQQNAYGTYLGASNTGPTELQMQTTNQYAGDDTAAAVYYQNTLGKRNSPMISNNLSQSTLAQTGNALLANQDIYATLQNPQLAQHHVNILGQGSYNIAQPTVVRYSPDDEGYSEETANSTNFTLEGTEV